MDIQRAEEVRRARRVVESVTARQARAVIGPCEVSSITEAVYWIATVRQATGSGISHAGEVIS
jgi:hypothetical protein